MIKITANPILEVVKQRNLLSFLLIILVIEPIFQVASLSLLDCTIE